MINVLSDLYLYRRHRSTLLNITSNCDGSKCYTWRGGRIICKLVVAVSLLERYEDYDDCRVDSLRVIRYQYDIKRECGRGGHTVRSLSMFVIMYEPLLFRTKRTTVIICMCPVTPLGQ